MLSDDASDNENYCLINVVFKEKQNIFKYNSSNTFNVFLSEVMQYFNIDNKLKLNFSYLNTFFYKDLELSTTVINKLLKENANKIAIKIDIDNKYLTKRYEYLQHKINKYGNATLILCYDNQRKEKVIIKKQKNDNYEPLEYEFLSNANNPLIIKAYDYFELKDLNDNTLYSYYTMPYFENGDLFTFINTHFKDKSVPLQLIFEIIYQISYGLFYMHSKRRITTKEIVVHRDIDPRNIFIKYFNSKTNEIQIVIGDFGHATTIDNSTALMNSGVGKTHYWSPEQYKGEEYDFKIDIWGLGVIFYQLLTKDFDLNVGLNFIKNTNETLQYMKTTIELHSEINNDNNELIINLLSLMISYDSTLRFTSVDVFDYLRNNFNYSSKYCKELVKIHNEIEANKIKRVLTEEEIEANKIMDELYENTETYDLILKLLNEDVQSISNKIVIEEDLNIDKSNLLDLNEENLDTPNVKIENKNIYSFEISLSTDYGYTEIELIEKET
ncbi:hypothetical protein ABK040_016154 [Willaertia magna]